MPSRIRPDEALRLRDDQTKSFFPDILTMRLVALNPGVVEGARAVKVIRQLSLLSATMAGNHDELFKALLEELTMTKRWIA